MAKQLSPRKSKAARPKSRDKRGLTAGQARLVACWDGDPQSSAAKAGVAYSSVRTWLTRCPALAKAIRARAAEIQSADVATTDEILRFWTQALREDRLPFDERNEAAKCLAKAHGMFIERRQHDVGPTLAGLIAEIAREDAGT